MGKRETTTRVRKQSVELRKKANDKWRALYEQIAPQKEIISDAGTGSRRANTAEKKIDSIHKKLNKLEEKSAHETGRILKDYDLAEQYGESAMEARGFGTDRGVDYSYAAKDPPIKSTHKLDRKKGKAKGGYVKKYAKGGGVRKVRS